jgi:hypothetical protein
MSNTTSAPRAEAAVASLNVCIFGDENHRLVGHREAGNKVREHHQQESFLHHGQKTNKQIEQYCVLCFGGLDRAKIKSGKLKLTGRVSRSWVLFASVFFIHVKAGLQFLLRFRLS